MENIANVLKELIQPLLSRAQGATIMFIFFITGMFVALIAPTLINQYPLVGTGVIALLLSIATYAIYRLEKR